MVFEYLLKHLNENYLRKLNFTKELLLHSIIISVTVNVNVLQPLTDFVSLETEKPGLRLIEQSLNNTVNNLKHNFLYK